MSELLQVWVRNDKGQVYGPLTPPSIELLIDNGVIAGRMQISTDGMNYVYPGRVPGLRVIFPRETWGDTVIPGDELDAEWGHVAMPAAVTGSLTGVEGGTGPGAPAGPPPSGPVGGPVAGPGARGPVAGPGIRSAPTAGPGTRPQVGRPGGPPPGVQSRPAGGSAPVRGSPSVADLVSGGAGPRAPVSAVGTGAAAPSAVRSSPSIADFINAATPSAQGRSPPTVSSQGGRSPPAARPSTPPPPAPTGDLRVPPSGVLGEVTTQHLYYYAAASETTGLLTVKLGDRELTLHFKKGNPEFLDSTHPEDSLETFLLAQKLATKAQIDQAQPQLARFGGELLSALFGLGILNPNAVFQHLGQRASQLLQRVLSAEQGTFSFDLEELPAARSMPLGNKWAVYLEALRRVPISDVRTRMVGVSSMPVMKGSGRVAVSEIRLTPQETRALNYFDGVRSLGQLTKELAGEGDVILRTAWMLAPLELISYADVPARAAAAPPPAPPRPAPAPAAAAPPPAPPRPAPAPAAAPPPRANAPAAVAKPSAAPGNPVNMPKPGMPYPGASGQASAPAAAPPPAAAPQRPPPPVMKPAAPARPVVTAAPPAAVDVEVDIKQLQALLEQMKKQNFFEVLGLKRDSDPAAVKVAYLKAARSHHPDTVPQGAPEALAKVKADLFALIGEANRTLSDPALRQDYAAELDAGGTGSKVNIEKILRAEECFQRGRILMQARKYPDGLKHFEESIACNPDEAEFYAWRGYAKFLSASDRKAASAEALRDLNLCVSKNPNVAATYYFLGFIAKFNGDEKNALVHFKKCVSLDPKHIDAQREVRSAGKK